MAGVTLRALKTLAKKAQSGMRFAIGIVVFVAVLVVAKLWTSGPAIGGLPAGALMGAGLCVIVVAWVAGVWVRNRRRKRVLSTRDSALW
jgi:ABC-type polysaccharide/polyol phosphate export permease